MGDIMDMPGEAQAPLSFDEIRSLAKHTLAKHRAAVAAGGCPHCGSVAPSTMAERIKELRLKRGLTQHQLADLCEVTKTSVSHWEAAETDNMGVQAFLKLLTALQTDFEYLAFGTGHAPPAVEPKNKRPRRRQR